MGNAWLPKQKSTRQRTMLTRTVSSRRMVLRITATVSRVQSARTRSRTRSPPTIRLRWNLQSRKPSSGSIPIQLRRKRSTKRNRSPSKALQCQFFRKWQVELVVCPVGCQVLAVCQTWEVAHHQVQTRARVPPLRKLIKRYMKKFHFDRAGATISIHVLNNQL